MSDISVDRGSLAVIIRLYRGAFTRWPRQHGHTDFAWQPRFFDHIIRHADALNRIRHYIRTNSSDWYRDKYHPNRL